MTERAKRATKPVVHPGMLDTSHPDFTSTLKLPSQHKGSTQRTSTPPLSGLARLLPTNSQERKMDELQAAYASPPPPKPASEEQVHTAAAAATAATGATAASIMQSPQKVEVRRKPKPAAAAAAKPKKKRGRKSDDEQSSSSEEEAYEPPEGEDEQSRPAEATRGKAKAKAAAASDSKRVTWTNDGDFELLEAVLDFVQSNGGALPSSQRTSKGSAASPAWTKIAKKVPIAMKGVKEAGKACGTRWKALKAKVKVRHTQNLMSSAGSAAATRTLAHPLPVCCCVQKDAARIYSHFKSAVDEKLAVDAAEAIDTEEMSGEVAKAALDGWIKKKVGDLWDHVTLNDNTQCAAVVIDEEWEMPDWVIKIWDKV